MTSPEPTLAAFQEHRSLLFGIAYRMLGSVSEAEDLVQETFIRWQRQAVDEVKSPKAWLTTAITRLCVDHLRSARVRREEYVGVWLPEPLLESQQNAEERPRALADSLSTAFLVLLETLSPAERAVYLLREVFEYDYSEIGEMLQKNEASCRQMLKRAREHVAGRESRYTPDPRLHEKLVLQFMETCQQGNTERLLAMLTEDSVIYSDGGGKVSAAPHPIVGDAKVARFLIGVSKIRVAGKALRFACINSAPGLLIYVEGSLVQTVAFDIVEGRVRALYIVRNPDKLRHVQAELIAIGEQIEGSFATP